MKFIKSGQGKLIEGRGYKKNVFVNGINLISNKALVQMIIINPNDVAPDHYHKKTTEVFYFLEGSGVFIVNDQEYKCFPGDILICESNEVHSTRNETNEVWKYLAFKTDIPEGDSYFLEKN